MGEVKKTRTLIRTAGGEVVDIGSFAAQMDLMRYRFNLPVTVCETHRIERRGEGFALVKRAVPIKIYDNGDGLKTLGLAPSQRSAGGKPSFAESRRGKYNDEGRLTMMNPMGAGLETREVQPVALI